MPFFREMTNPQGGPMLEDAQHAQTQDAPSNDDAGGGQTETLSTSLPDDVEDAARDLLEAASEAELGLTSAESCTGGLLASILTDVEGRSSVFERAFVVYSPEAKCELLGLKREMVDDCGAVSEQVARALAEAALDRSNAQVAVGITGFTGRGGPNDEPGLVHLAVARHGADTRHEEHHYGDIGRGPARIRTVRDAIRMMREAI